ncbi:uncharacterized protein YjbI with pentapeptide repeats [Lipingzhangella halophila]|uniref:Uncharacterized protein YjbI with pentapeptide repeats n=1 Tax=Lipingzhangella halophila TaxID=1783352 RepID=A0A7W7RL72_9ACTN|nr:hypothetical protein [Lipingzhangella halophila]MBB4934037.1 uncharacterized protein YjbI with pentapeptide repeats [Lipingzhangella halophila]
MSDARPFRWFLPAERALWRAFPTRSPVDLRRGDPKLDDPRASDHWGRARTVRAPVIAALLLGALPADPDSVPGIRLAGARIVGRLELGDSTLAQTLELEQCDLTGVLALDNASTKGVHLRDCQLHRLQAGRCRVEGDLALSGTTVLEGVDFSDAQVGGQLRMNRARILPPARATLAAAGYHVTFPGDRSDWAVWAGGVSVQGGFFGRGLDCPGGIRLIGANLAGGLHLQGAEITARGEYAMDASHLTSGLVELSRGFTAQGTIRLRSARIDGILSFDRAHLTGGRFALHLSHADVTELIFAPESIEGLVGLGYSRFGVLLDHPSSYPDGVWLTGTTYEQLRGEWTPAERRDWVSPGSTEGYRPQPYEQLAAWYRTVGNEPAARTVLLAKQRARRATLNPAGRLWGLLLDAIVGYGYRPWLAAMWAAVLLAVGTAVFHAIPPNQIPQDEQRTFVPFIYTLDLLVPVSVFEERGAWQPVGWTRWLAWSTVAAGWILATALIAGATRVLRGTSP